MKLAFLLFVISFACYKCLDFHRCSLYDSKCQKDFFQNVARTYAAEGIPEIGIPVIDPFRVTNESLYILGLWKMTLIVGDAVGIRSCRVTKYETNVEDRYREAELICDEISIKGHYKLTSAPLLKKTFADYHGYGKMRITLENWFFKIRYPFEIVREANREIYVKGVFDKAVYVTDVGNLFIQINGIKIGVRDISHHVNCFVNSNWQLIMASDIGHQINSISMQYYYEIYSIFFNNVSADKYLTDDLSKLVDRVNY